MKEASMDKKTVDMHIFRCATAVKSLVFMLVVLLLLNSSMLRPCEKNGILSKWFSPIEEWQNLDGMSSDAGKNETRLLMKLAADLVQKNDSVVVSGNGTSKEKVETEKKSENGNSFVESEKPAEAKIFTVSGNGTSKEKVETEKKSENGNSFVESEKPAETKFFTVSGNGTSKEKVETEKKSENGNSFVESEKPAETTFFTETAAQNKGMICEFSNYRYNMCSIEVNLKVIGSTSTVLLIPQTSTAPANSTVWKLRPFPRKWEHGTIERSREVTMQWASHENQGPDCEVTHDVPVLIFSTAGFGYSPFHAYTDSLIPLFIAANPHNGKVQFAVTNVDWKLVNMYMPFIKALSHYSFINLDSETKVHCFPSGEVGLRGTGPLAVDNSSAQNGYTMKDFMHFLMTSLSLERTQVEKITNNSNKKSKIGILLRKYTREFTNENEIIEMAEGVGFEVIQLNPETTSDFPRIAHLINSCDVLMGVHGAGLTNMLYLPNNATLIQIVPWGGEKLGFISYKDFGEPAEGRGLNYIQYEIKEEESTLIEKYPRNHTVFTNPQALHDQGWGPMYTVFLVEQKVKLDVQRFRQVLGDVFNSLHHEQQRK